tara:strand:- start:298 stop:1566 length:1269 start_codon:yes stop_codon:yes gene_type:complete
MNKIIGIIGLGYVGFPLSIEFAKKYKTIGFDINKKRVEELNNFQDNSNEVESKVIENTFSNTSFKLTSILEDIKKCNIYIITVPTPINKNKKPLLDPLIKSSKMISSILKKGDIVIYESTVYPGLTEEICVPILSEFSGLIYNKDFFVGYSPERINPGDKEHTVSKILKLTSGSNDYAANEIDKLYKSIISAGTFKTSSIRVAEAAKVIENTQRDINIAFVNELSQIFNLLNIDTLEVLEAAGTKWNFLNFKPGLVGGHCIGVDPYYLANKALEVGYNPEIILAGRRINDNMSMYVVMNLIKTMIKKKIDIINSKVLILGFSFKENCPDYRNTKIFEIIKHLKQYEIDIEITDPLVDSQMVKKEYNLNINKEVSSNSKFDAIILAVNHNEFKEFDFKKHLKDVNVIFDLKGFYNKTFSDFRL